jgi:DNA-binding beta-propeller fold protein YncE
VPLSFDRNLARQHCRLDVAAQRHDIKNKDEVMTLKPLALAAATAAAFATAPAHAAFDIGWEKLWTLDFAGAEAEIVDFDAMSQTLWVSSPQRIDVISLVERRVIDQIDLSSFGDINSVSIHGGLAAVAVASSTVTDPGRVYFYDTLTRASSGFVGVGALPDMVTFTNDGTRVLVANEGEPAGGVDPMGSVSIIDMATRNVTTASLAGVPLLNNVRSASVADMEPEYIAVSPDNTTAFVTLQEANAVGMLDLNSASFTKIVGLGTKDFSAAGNGIDANDKDGVTALVPVNARGLYQPDGIGSYAAGGQTYFVTANEGDARADESDEARAKDIGVTGALSRLTISTLDSTPTDLVAFGARSFSIWDADGNQVFDSGNQLEVEAIARGIYDEGRSDNKGVEPEGVSLMEIDGRTIAFIGLERTTQSAIAMYDVTDPANASFIDMIVGDNDIAPEGLKAFSVGGRYYLAVSNEVSATTSLYALAPVPEPETWAMMMAGLGLMGAVARRRR